ncbi:BURP domain-containing protein [Artemisia annua]|uniref:BURP domain-containing protein n=1 Tax=Artemisia annua TaxID=35608 RepID=A0A2U1M493_ARTAN|nr:BURP domain-containing protein [Artemisia annua]
MKINLVHFYTLLSVALVVSDAVTPEVYWKLVLPDSPMPTIVKDLLYPTGMRVHATHKEKPGYTKVQPETLKTACTDTGSEDQFINNMNGTMYFLENDLLQGTEMKLNFGKNKNQKLSFIPRKVSDSIPFSSNKLPHIYNEFSVTPDSIEAKIIKQTIDECEKKDIQGEDTTCVTSLESMVDFGIARLGKNVKAITTEVKTKKDTSLQIYKVEGAKKVNSNEFVICHKKNYAYAVFYCHKSVDIRVYMVSLVGVDGTKVNGVAVCSTDTGKWNPNHLAFQVLNVKPATVPICNFLSEDHVTWVPY